MYKIIILSLLLIQIQYISTIMFNNHCKIVIPKNNSINNSINETLNDNHKHQDYQQTDKYNDINMMILLMQF
jgi:hypothetical protein